MRECGATPAIVGRQGRAHKQCEARVVYFCPDSETPAVSETSSGGEVAAGRTAVPCQPPPNCMAPVRCWRAVFRCADWLRGCGMRNCPTPRGGRPARLRRLARPAVRSVSFRACFRNRRPGRARARLVWCRVWRFGLAVCASRCLGARKLGVSHLLGRIDDVGRRATRTLTEIEGTWHGGVAVACSRAQWARHRQRLHCMAA